MLNKAVRMHGTNDLRLDTFEMPAIQENEILVKAGVRPPEVPLNGHGDHRIAMSLAVLLSQTGGTLTGAEAVSKSLPDFFERLKRLGIEAEQID